MDSRAITELAVDAIEELKGQNIVELDVSRLTDVTDHMVIASGRSDRQVKALAEHVIEKAKEQGIQPLGVEGLDRGEWVLVDLCDVVVHLMQPESRDYYQLEKLWSGLDDQATAGGRGAGTS